MSANFSQEDFLALPPERQLELLPLLEELAARGHRARAKDDFYYFCQSVYPGYVKGTHLKLLCEKLDAVARGEIKRLIIAMPPRHPVWEEHRVLLADGTRPRVRDVQVGDQIITHRARARCVTAVHVQGELPTLRIVTHGGRELYVHDTHPMLTPAGWTPASECRVGTALAAVLNSDAGVARVSWRDWDADSPFDMPMAVAAELAGYIVGDGSTSQKNMGITIDYRETAQVARVKQLVEACGWTWVKSSAKHAWRITTGEGCPTGVAARAPEHLRKRPFLWATQAGLLGTSYTKRIPEWVMQGDAATARAFLSGYFTTDGCVSSRGYDRKSDVHLDFCSVSRALMEDAQHLLARIGVAARLRKKENRKLTPNDPSGAYVSWHCVITDTSNAVRLMRQLHVPHSKRERFAALYERDFSTPFAPDQIVSIDRVEPRRHRCFTIEEDESFTIEDIAVHNSKSQHSSIFFPAYFLGRQPNAQIITASHTADLAKGFGRKVRDLIDSTAYRDVFGSAIALRADVKAAGQWQTDQGGAYYAAGVDSALAGRGASLLCLDDLIDEQKAIEAQHRPEVFEKVYEWYLLARQRLMPGGAVVLCATRWALNDPTGLILERSKEDWEILTLPALWEDGRTLWPEFWKPEEILKLKEEMPPLRWSATYQQAPEQGGGTLIQPDWLQWWPHENPPKKIESIIVSLDPAFSDKDRADPSAFVVAGIFTAGPGELGGPRPGDPSDAPIANIIVLDAFETRENFPDLKQTCVDIYRQWRPEGFMIESKASGVPLIQELKLIGLPVTAFDVNRGTKGNANDKISRVNRTLPIYQALRVWLPENRAWADHFATQLTRFPMVSHDDLVDAMTQILVYFRNTRLITTPTDDSIGDFSDSDSEKPGLAGFGGYLSSVFK